MIKRIISIAVLLCLCLIFGCGTNNQQDLTVYQEQISAFAHNVVSISEASKTATHINEMAEYAISDSLEQIKNYTPEIDYESLFDFSGWEEDFNATDNKDSFMESYWRKIAAETISNYDIYKLILNDEKAKEAFLSEIREQMILQVEAYLKSSKITVDDEMIGFIEDMVDKQINDFRKSIH